MTQPTLFDEPKSRHSDPPTSKAAASRVAPMRPSIRKEILEALAIWGPATDDQLCVRLNIDPRRWPTVKTARSALTHCEAGWVVSTGVVKNGQTIWRHRDYPSYVEAVEVAGGVL